MKLQLLLVTVVVLALERENKKSDFAVEDKGAGKIFHSRSCRYQASVAAGASPNRNYQ
jgi:hypothetical protein